MKKLYHRIPLYLFLLSLFFVFHGYTENYNYIPVRDALILLFIYLAASLVIAGALWIFYRNFSKAGFVAFLAMGFFFFFGYIHDNLLALAPGQFLSRHSTVLIAGFSIILLAFVLLFFRKKPLTKLNYALNIFLTLLLVVDAAWLVSRMVTHKKYTDTAFANQFTICDTCAKPDIYLIIPDLYAGEGELRDMMNFDNSAFAGELIKRGFRYLPKSKSNYNYTTFSVASTLQMEYLGKIKGSNSHYEDLTMCYNAIRQNRVTRLLLEHGYQFENFSLFDIFDQPSPMKKTVLPEKTKFITAQTLFNRLKNDARLNLAKFLGDGQQTKRLYTIYNVNENLYGKTIRLQPEKNNKPRFVYTHLTMPHNPYYFKKDGTPNPVSELKDEKVHNIPAYIEYLQYTNQKLLSLVDTIFLKSKTPPIIILLSDHGFREFFNPAEVEGKYFFMNLAAVYMPGKNYSSFYDSMSNVNIFRAVLNAQFHQKFQLLKDSTYYIDQ